MDLLTGLICPPCKLSVALSSGKKDKDNHYSDMLNIYDVK